MALDTFTLLLLLLVFFFRFKQNVPHSSHDDNILCDVKTQCIHGDKPHPSGRFSKRKCRCWYEKSVFCSPSFIHCLSVQLQSKQVLLPKVRDNVSLSDRDMTGIMLLDWMTVSQVITGRVALAGNTNNSRTLHTRCYWILTGDKCYKHDIEITCKWI